ncbi:MBL fold metallo-hydrolase [Bacteroidia bacterium]|nr:MBL fold metallo-hydrolase [Bacteroidia bacterium]
MKNSIYLFLILGFMACAQPEHRAENESEKTEVKLIVLGTVQDAGSPHIACTKGCCTDLIANPDHTRKVVSLGIVDELNKQTYLFEATPDMPAQLKMLVGHSGFQAKELSNGIFLTHAHIGHYTGLMYLGKEAINAVELPVYAMPRMDSFLRNYGPWSQLVHSQNIYLNRITARDTIDLNDQLKVIPFRVPHRDEYSETVGYKVIGPNKAVLFIPDIDKWSKWEHSIANEISQVDYAFVDATFYDGDEIKSRDISQIPHPFVIESMELLKGLVADERSKVHFIHFNHTNPLLDSTSNAYHNVLKKGFNIAQFNQVLEL